ncbi:ATP-binding protein [Candidatus Micrarchaeota archaeon]|nr:ATP-binding protein [Candidatus Micrarchaeota archaeon]
MAVPTKKEILDFSPFNTGGIEELPQYKRRYYNEVKQLLNNGLILAVTGLRRVGKTTLIKQLLGKNFFCFSFDEKRYANPETLKAVIDTFISETEKPVIFLDEVFRVDDWAGLIKRYHDQKKAKFILSGSSALLVKKGIESLSGRLSEYYLPPLQFDEYLEMKGYRAGQIAWKDMFGLKNRHLEELENFLKTGSFPEIAAGGFDEKTSLEYIKTSTVEKIVFDDIPMAFRIEHPSKLYDLLKLCATNSSKLFTETNFSEALAISRHSVSDYLLYLKKAYLIDVIYPEGSFQKGLKKQKKVFVKAASIYHALAENPTIGQAAETAVYDRLSQENITFYRDGQKREIDFISGLPVEVKYQSTITSDDARHILYYLEKTRKPGGIIITKDLFDERTVHGKKITFIPLDVFLLLKNKMND